jgi:integrase
MGQRVRERTGLDDTPLNRKQVQKQLNLITAEIENGVFEFAKRFPHSKRIDHFAELEGRQVTQSPSEVLFGDYVEKWWRDMEPGMSINKIRDYQSALNSHLLPHFGRMPLSEFTKVRMKKFVALMKSKKNVQGKPLSGRRIQNVMIPLRIIVRDAIDEFGWTDFADPFANLKVPKARKSRAYPFSFDEWQTLMGHVPAWYRPYFEFAVQTGLRPSEQVALKWSAIDDRFIHIELSRVRNVEKEDLKTEERRRMIEIRLSASE